MLCIGNGGSPPCFDSPVRRHAPGFRRRRAGGSGAPPRMKVRLAALLRAPAQSAAVLVAAGAFVSLAGWATGLRAIQPLFPGADTVHPFTAFCFLLLGVSLW